MNTDYVRWYRALGMKDVAVVGGKNASLGEMISHLAGTGVAVPDGFATTANAFRLFCEHNGLAARIEKRLLGFDVDRVSDLQLAGAEIRGWIADTPLPQDIEQAISSAYAELAAGDGAMSFAVRSSATAEDLPDASFAGQQETYLNVSGCGNVLAAIKRVFASLYNDRAIAYRVHQGFANASVALSAGVQRMVRSDIAASGVMFTLDTESGFRDVVFITAAYGLGETVVQGTVNPDEFYVHKATLDAGRPAILKRERGSKLVKMIYADAGDGVGTRTVEVSAEERGRFSLSDAEVEALARQALIIERHYGRPMDIEWGKDGNDGGLYVLQARPETVKARSDAKILRRYHLSKPGKVRVTGRSVGQSIAVGKVRVVADVAELDQLQAGEVLVSAMTDPDWEPVMKRAAALVTDRGGRTCHAAIIARELGIPAVVGCGNATASLRSGETVTVSCAGGDTGYVYEGALDNRVSEIRLDRMPPSPVKIMMNVGNPERAFDFAGLPNSGVGLARVEFLINRVIGVHPKALIEYDKLEDSGLKAAIGDLIAGYGSPTEYYVGKLAEGISTLAAAFLPEPVILRMSDFKSNEYANLLGGQRYEPHEENPMLGFRGASRYVAESFRDCFALECQALKRVRDDMGFTNVEVMIPFVRTVAEARRVTELLTEEGLTRGNNGLRLIMMCEIPSNAILADRFLEYFDGFSIGSNDLTQLTLGLDRDSGLVAGSFDERDAAVKALMSLAIQACKRAGKYVGICGQGPSDFPDLAQWLVEQGIDSLSLNPDTVVETWMYLAELANKGPVARP